MTAFGSPQGGGMTAFGPRAGALILSNAKNPIEPTEFRGFDGIRREILRVSPRPLVLLGFSE